MASGLAAEEIARIEGEQHQKLSFGNLRKLNFKGGSGHYTLNNVELVRVSSDAVDLSTADQSFRVRATLLGTVLISKSRPANAENQDLLHVENLQDDLADELLRSALDSAVLEIHASARKRHGGRSCVSPIFEPSAGSADHRRGRVPPVVGGPSCYA
jgi:hypothetical protein